MENEHEASYVNFLDRFYSLLDGSTDNSKFEDSLRGILGTGSYMLYTMDKLVSAIAKTLHIMASDTQVRSNPL